MKFASWFSVYSSECECVKFLLGGIGTGNFSIGSRGQFCDFEWFGQSGKGNTLPCAFPAIWCRKEGGAPVARVLESGPVPPHNGAHGHSLWELAGLPRFHKASMRSRMPFVFVDFEDDSLPVSVTLEGFTPFIPLNSDDSGIPGAVLRYHVKNPTDQRVEASVCITMPNASGYMGEPNGKFSLSCPELSHYVTNEWVEGAGFRGLYDTCHDPNYDRLRANSIALLTPDQNVSALTEWTQGSLFDGITDFWEEFSKNGTIGAARKELPETFRNTFAALKTGSLCVSKTIEPGETESFTFCLTWYFPLREKDWTDTKPVDNNAVLIKNYYGVLFQNAFDAGKYLLENLPRLEQQSRMFSDALYGSTLPPYVIEAAADNLTVLRSPTCMRLEDGTFVGWEGCFDHGGCCEGTCAHVWNYAQSVAFLFPELEISARETELLLETSEEGHMTYRTQRVFGNPKWDYIPAADGQAGALIRMYREWKLTGDDDFLQKVWPKAKRALAYLFEHFDLDHDLLPEGEQHTTYDTEFYGPNPLVCSLLYGAVAAMYDLACYLGETEYALELSDCYKKGTYRADQLLWNGSYYVQRLENLDSYRCQFGGGCLSDQLFGQFLAFVTGLGYLFPQKHVIGALNSIFDYNFSEKQKKPYSIGRGYAMEDEPRLTICTWPQENTPEGKRPQFPFFYADEVWTGVEYQVASSLIYAGEVEKGLQIAEAVRKRHDGTRRSPYNERECGHHYARSLASWGLITALSGFQYDMARGKTVFFDPKIHQNDFHTFFSTGLCWGIYHQHKNDDGSVDRSLEILYGDTAVHLL